MVALLISFLNKKCSGRSDPIWLLSEIYIFKEKKKKPALLFALVRVWWGSLVAKSMVESPGNDAVGRWGPALVKWQQKASTIDSSEIFDHFCPLIGFKSGRCTESKNVTGLMFE